MRISTAIRQPVMSKTATLKWLLLLTKPYYGTLFILMLMNATTSLLSVGSAVIAKYVVDSATSGESLLANAILFVVMSALVICINVGASLFATVLSEKYAFHIRKSVFERIIKTKWLEVTKYHSGDLLTRLKSDVTAVADGVTNISVSILTLAVRFIAAFVALMCYDKVLATLALVMGPLAALCAWWVGKKMKFIQKKVQESEAKYSSFMQECISNITIIKTFAAESQSIDKLQELYVERLHWVLKKNRMSIIAGALVSSSFSVGYVMAFLWGAVKLSMGLITYGTVTVFLSLVGQIQGPVFNLAQMIPQIISVSASAERIMELNCHGQEDDVIHIPNSPKHFGLKIENLDYGYCESKVLDNLSLSVKPGEFVAIIGPSGVGKTTLIRLILNLLYPHRGSISFMDGDTVFMEACPSMRELIAYVPQGNTLFSGTIADNLRIGKPDAPDADLWNTLDIAACDFVRDLPEGINTVIGERGHRLSEGQSQRIAIARALVRKSPILIMDEATSALDEMTELRVIQAIKALHSVPTCIVITHRKSVLQYCDSEFSIEYKKS